MPGEKLLVDNDVLVKLTRWGLETKLFHHCCDQTCVEPVRILGTAKWVCKASLERAVRQLGEDPRILTWFDEAMVHLESVEPAPSELEAAAYLEDEAVRRGLPLDPGESILAAVAATRDGILLTGDKRAIQALEELATFTTALSSLKGRVASLEHAMMTLLVHHGYEAVENAVRRAPRADGAMRLVFSSPAGSSTTRDGLQSYLDSITARAPSVVIPAQSLCFCEVPV